MVVDEEAESSGFVSGMVERWKDLVEAKRRNVAPILSRKPHCTRVHVHDEVQCQGGGGWCQLETGAGSSLPDGPLPAHVGLGRSRLVVHLQERIHAVTNR